MPGTIKSVAVMRSGDPGGGGVWRFHRHRTGGSLEGVTMTANLSVDLDKVRELIREAPPGTTIVVAPDIHDKLLEGQVLASVALGNSHGVQVRKSSAAEPGTVMVMVSGHIPAPISRANRFLAKSGPGATMAQVKLEMPAAAEAAPPRPPKPPKPPQPPPSPKPPPRPKTRQRIVDT
jgi:hypothetical protein